MSLTICTDAVVMIKEYARVRDLLVSSCDYGNGSHTEESIVHGLISREYTLWTSKSSAMLCCFNEVPVSNFKSLFVVAAAGDLNEIRSLEPELFEFAKASGCQNIEVSGRPGWQRALASLGYELSSVNLIKRI